MTTKHGEWGYGKTKHKIVCSVCGSPRPYTKKEKGGYCIAWESNFCPNCGAKMTKEE